MNAPPSYPSPIIYSLPHRTKILNECASLVSLTYYILSSPQNQNFALRLQQPLLTNGITAERLTDAASSNRQANESPLPRGVVSYSASSVGGSNSPAKVNSKFNIIPSIFGGSSPSEDDKPTEFLDESAYIAAGALKPGADAYSRNKFNQAESDRLASNRGVPDTRNQM